MAGICEGQWLNSRIGGSDDGTIEVTQSAGGRLGGRHVNSRREIFGVCREGNHPHLTFVRFEGLSLHLYHGDIVRVFSPVAHFEIQGFVQRITLIPQLEALRNETADAIEARTVAVDDWTAERPT